MNFLTNENTYGRSLSLRRHTYIHNYVHNNNNINKYVCQNK